jgi:sugar phosphate isomerase/epimerase
MKRSVDLMNLFWTTAGIFPGTGDVSRFDFKARVEAAARAGFTGIGLWHTDLDAILRHNTLRDMKQLLDAHGMRHIELEFLTDWFLTDARKAESDRQKRRLLEASEALQAKHIKIGDFHNTACPMPQIVDAFAALCTEAEAYGATIGFEFMASAMIDNLADARALVETVGAKNGGLILDIVHVVNLGISYDDIRRIPLQYVINVELNDGTLPGSPQHDPSRDRRFCGEGEFDLTGFITCMTRIGYRGPWGVEVFSNELVGLSLDELNTRAYSTTMAQFDALDTEPPSATTPPLWSGPTLDAANGGKRGDFPA